MDLQTIINNEITRAREERMKTSTQLTLGELILKLEPLVEKQPEMIKKYGHEAAIVFDFSCTFPVGLSSWRGSYAELALEWAGGDYSTNEKQLKLSEFLDLLKSAIGKTYTGWKGGDYVMGKNTPIWVANPGNVGETAVIDVVDEEYEIILITRRCKY